MAFQIEVSATVNAGIISHSLVLVAGIFDSLERVSLEQFHFQTGTKICKGKPSSWSRRNLTLNWRKWCTDSSCVSFCWRKSQQHHGSRTEWSQCLRIVNFIQDGSLLTRHEKDTVHVLLELKIPNFSIRRVILQFWSCHIVIPDSHSMSSKKHEVVNQVKVYSIYLFPRAKSFFDTGAWFSWVVRHCVLASNRMSCYTSQISRSCVFGWLGYNWLYLWCSGFCGRRLNPIHTGCDGVTRKTPRRRLRHKQQGRRGDVAFRGRRVIPAEARGNRLPHNRSRRSTTNFGVLSWDKIRTTWPRGPVRIVLSMHVSVCRRWWRTVVVWCLWTQNQPLLVWVRPLTLKFNGVHGRVGHTVRSVVGWPGQEILVALLYAARYLPPTQTLQQEKHEFLSKKTWSAVVLCTAKNELRQLRLSSGHIMSGLWKIMERKASWLPDRSKLRCLQLNACCHDERKRVWFS